MSAERLRWLPGALHGASLVVLLAALAPPPAAAQTGPEWPQAADASGWRDRLTPWQDPARTRPARLEQPLNKLLDAPPPPDLMALPPAPPASGLDCGPPDGGPGSAAAPARAAASPQHSQWALQTLLSGQPDAPAGQPPLLTLPAAMHLALCHNPQVRATWPAIAQQAAQVGQAQSGRWPQVSAGLARQRSRVSYGPSDVPSHTTWATSKNAVIAWRLWDWGARSARTAAAQAQLQAALYTQDATVHQTLTELLQTWGRAQAAQTRLHTQQTLAPLASRTVQAARRRQAGGAGSAHDTVQAQAAQARIQLELSRAQGEYAEAAARLAYLTGLPAAQPLRLQDVFPAGSEEGGADSADDIGLSADADADGQTAAPEAGAPAAHDPDQPADLGHASSPALPPLPDWLEQARQRHPAILAARAQWQAAQEALRAAQSEGLPTLDLNLAHYRNGRPNNAITASRTHENVLGLSLTVPLFDGFASTYKVRAAQAQAEQKYIEYQAAQEQTLQTLAQLHTQTRSAWQNLRLARQLWRLSMQAAQSTHRQYAAGAADITQLNQSLTQLQQAQLDLSQTLTEWNRARLSLWLQEAAIH